MIMVNLFHHRYNICRWLINWYIYLKGHWTGKIGYLFFSLNMLCQPRKYGRNKKKLHQRPLRGSYGPLKSSPYCPVSSRYCPVSSRYCPVSSRYCPVPRATVLASKFQNISIGNFKTFWFLFRSCPGVTGTELNILKSGSTVETLLIDTLHEIFFDFSYFLMFFFLLCYQSKIWPKAKISKKFHMKAEKDVFVKK